MYEKNLIVIENTGRSAPLRPQRIPQEVNTYTPTHPRTYSYILENIRIRAHWHVPAFAGNAQAINAIIVYTDIT